MSTNGRAKRRTASKPARNGDSFSTRAGTAVMSRRFSAPRSVQRTNFDSRHRRGGRGTRDASRGTRASGDARAHLINPPVAWPAAGPVRFVARRHNTYGYSSSSTPRGRGSSLGQARSGFMRCALVRRAGRGAGGRGRAVDPPREETAEDGLRVGLLLAGVEEGLVPEREAGRRVGGVEGVFSVVAVEDGGAVARGPDVLDD